MLRIVRLSIFSFLWGVSIASLASAQSWWNPEHLQLRAETGLSSEPKAGTEGEKRAPATEIDVIRVSGDWSLVRDHNNKTGWVRNRLIEPVGSCHQSGSVQFRFVARHYGFIASDVRFDEVGITLGGTRGIAPTEDERHLSHTELSLKMGLARYEKGTAALLFYHGASASCVLVVDASGIIAYAVNKSANGPVIDRMVHDYLRSIVPESCWSARAPTDVADDVSAEESERAAKTCQLKLAGQLTDEAPLRDLSTTLFPPPIEAALRSYKNLIIVPYGSLSIVPFAALELPKEHILLIDRFAYSIAPAFTQIGIGKGIHIARKNVSERPRAVVVGNPKYKDADWRMPNLPGAENEARTVAGLLHVEPLLGESATIENLRGMIATTSGSAVDILYFASHGLASVDDASKVTRDGKYSSFVALANGERLSLSSLHSTAYNGSRLVVLSACMTGRGWIAETGTVGLPRLFHLRGAEEVVMSLWRVDDKATQSLMELFVADYVKSWPQSSAATSMRLAIQALRKTHTKPAYWAAFSVFGVAPFN